MTKLLKVIWDDSAMYTEWYDMEELRAMIRDWKTVKTVGYLILEDENRIVLAGSIDGSGDKYSNITVIPNSAIISKEEIQCKRSSMNEKNIKTIFHQIDLFKDSEHPINEILDQLKENITEL